MAHLSLDILQICSSFNHPGRPRRSQATPVHKADADLSTGWLDVAREDIVIAKRRSLPQRLKHEIIGTIRLHDLVLANGALAAAPYFDREPFESVDSLRKRAHHTLPCQPIFRSWTLFPLLSGADDSGSWGTCW